MPFPYTQESVDNAVVVYTLVSLNILVSQETHLREREREKEKLPFWTKFKAFGDRFFFFEELDFSTAKYQTILFICCVP